MGDQCIQKLRILAYTIPTDKPESDGTLQWNQTTIVLAQAFADGVIGMGYAYGELAAASLLEHKLGKLMLGRPASDAPAIRGAMIDEIRNAGRPGIASTAIAAADNALWDLRARLLNLPLVSLLGSFRQSIAAYGSGGFTSYTLDELREQLSGWVKDGIRSVKMKVGREAAADARRVQAAREAIGPATELMVDASGAYARKEALQHAQAFAGANVTWFEEPVSSDDIEGLRLIRDSAPPGMEIAAGEYGYDVRYFEKMIAAGAVDVLQADATRCGGLTGFLATAAVCEAHCIPLSAHTAPSLHAHPCCAVRPARNVEYFHDHVRIEQTLFDGALRASQGQLTPDRSRPGLGLELKESDVEQFKQFDSTVGKADS